MREREIFLAASEFEDEDERLRFLEQACGDDLMLRQGVDELLAIDREELILLSRSPLEATGSLGVETPEETEGTVLGRYKLLEKIGEGGFALVFMVEQTEPVRRRVALKIIKAGMDTKQVIARFEAERQALALMDHPNIAKVHDAGATENRRPYFVMELVQGVPITEYCDQCNLTTRERLELFITVCQAVHHAHQRGVIHRDIKPSNVLVAIQDGQPAPKIIDFGVAKAINQQLTERTLMTAFAQIVGTPLYMSPEQAELSPLGVDTRSDIYSLGVLLYELLTGTTPYDKDRLHAAPFDELRRIIREEEPPRPSTRISTLAADVATTVAERRRTDARRLGQTVRGELDWIAMKCLEKDRNRRYETANGLARDIERYLTDEPVQACPPSAGYRFRKFARRNKVALMTTILVTVALILGTVTSTWQAIRATQAQHAEVQARKQAEELAEENRLFAYAPRINMAHHAWESCKFDRVRELLDSVRPRKGQRDLRGFEWHYLSRLSHRDDVGGHTAAIRWLAFDPEGKRLATAGEDGRAMVWDAMTGQKLFELEGHTDAVTGIEFSPDGRFLATSSFDQTVRLWDAVSGEQRREFKGLPAIIGSVAFHPNGTRLVASDSVGRLMLWDLKTGEKLLEFQGHNAPARSVVFSPDGKYVASGSFDHTARLWDATTGKPVFTLEGHTGSVWSVVFSRDGKWLASCSHDDTVCVWDTSTGERKSVLTGHTDDVMGVAFHPDGRRLASGSADKSVRVWDWRSGQVLLSLNAAAGVQSVVFSRDAKRLAAGNRGHTGRIWDATTGRELLILGRHTPTYRSTTDTVVSIAFHPDGQRLAWSNSDGTVIVIDATTGQAVYTLKEHTATVYSVAFSPDGRWLATGGADEWVCIWDAETGQKVHKLVGHSAVACISFTHDSQCLATGTFFWTVKLWNVMTGQELQTIEQDAWTAVTSLAFSQDGHRLATGDLLRRITLWDMATGKQLFTCEGHAGPIHSMAFSSDGKRLASSGAYGDQVVKVWEMQSGGEIFSLAGHTDSVLGVAFSPDGRRLASASSDRTIKLWDAESGQEIITLREYTTPVHTVAFSLDGHRLASASADGIVKVWDATPLHDQLGRSSVGKE